MKKLIITCIIGSMALSSFGYACGGHKHRHTQATKPQPTSPVVTQPSK